MILAFSLRPILFRQDNYSFQFDADNKSRCCCQFTSFCLAFFFNLSTASIMVTSLLSLRITKRFRGCEASSEDVNKNITITQWTKTYEAVISTVTCFQDKFNGKYIDLWGHCMKIQAKWLWTWDKSRTKLRSRMILAFSLRPISSVSPSQLFFSVWFHWMDKIIWSNDLDSDLFSRQV